MHGVTKITTASNIMMISYQDASPAFMAETLSALANAGVVVDMISQTAPVGSKIRFGFTASFDYFDAAIKALGGHSGSPAPMISSGYSKINLFGEEMVESVGVAARALKALEAAGLEVAMVTTSDLDISILLRCEDEDEGAALLRKAYGI